MLSQSRLKAACSPAWRELSSISSLTCFSSVGSERSRCAAGTDWPSRAIASVARLDGAGTARGRGLTCADPQCLAAWPYSAGPPAKLVNASQ